MVYKDQLNRTLSFTETPSRIVSLVPSQTELLFLLIHANSLAAFWM